MLLLTFLLQIRLEEGSVTALPCKIPRYLVASRTGKFVVVGEPTAIHILDGESLKPLRKLEQACTAVGFDEKDETFTAVGDVLVRYETKEWKELSRAPLPEADFKKWGEPASEIIVKLEDEELGYEPGQAWIDPDGRVYFASKSGSLCVAQEKAGTTEHSILALRQEGAHPEKVSGVLGRGPPDVLIVTLARTHSGIARNQRVYRLSRSGHPLGISLWGNQLLFVGRENDGIYDAKTWKLLWDRPMKNEAVAFDAKRGWVFTAQQTRISAWHASKPGDRVECEKLQGSVVALSIDGRSRTLYGADSIRLHSWSLRE